MTTLTSFSSLEISELEVKGLILSLFQVILVADGSNYLSHFFGTISHGNLKEITSTVGHSLLNLFSARAIGKGMGKNTSIICPNLMAHKKTNIK